MIFQYKTLWLNGNKRSKCDNNKDMLILFAFTTIQLNDFSSYLWMAFGSIKSSQHRFLIWYRCDDQPTKKIYFKKYS